MKHRFFSAMLAILAMPFAASAQSPGADTVEFDWRGETFSLAVPEGYCLPRGQQKAITRQNAEGDSQNETVVDLQRCGTFGEAYILIKTPRDLPALNVPKSQFIDLVSRQFSDELVEQGIERGSKDVSNMSNGQVGVRQRDYTFVGTDEECAYLAGTMTLDGPDASIDVRAGSCLTLVGTRNFAVHVYDNRPAGESVSALRQRSRQVAEAIALK